MGSTRLTNQLKTKLFAIIGHVSSFPSFDDANL